jgi:hypothetical protein
MGNHWGLGFPVGCLVPYPYRRVDMQAVFSLQRSGLSHPPALLLPLGRRDYVNVADDYVVHHGCTAFRFRFAHSQQVHGVIELFVNCACHPNHNRVYVDHDGLGPE